MKKMAFVLAALSGCVHGTNVFHLSEREQCSLDGLVSDNYSHGGAEGVTAGGNSSGIFHSSNSEIAQQLNCRRPTSHEERCELQSILVGAKYKQHVDLLAAQEPGSKDFQPAPSFVEMVARLENIRDYAFKQCMLFPDPS